MAVGLAWTVARLPLSGIYFLGRMLARATYGLAHSRRRVAATNLAACFPDLDDAARKKLLHEVFLHTTLGALETMIPWLNPGRDLSDRIDVDGIEHYERARDAGRGVLVLAAHFTTLDVISQPLGRIDTFDVMYRHNKNPVWEWLQVTGRLRYFDGVVERRNTREVVRRLRKGRSIWYAADQDYGAKHSVFAPFFGIPTASITATARFAKLNNSPVVMMTTHRDIENKRWRIAFHPQLEDYPSGDDVADATRINAMIETFVRQQPEQYLWLHKRFKTRPEGEPRFYV